MNPLNRLLIVLLSSIIFSSCESGDNTNQIPTHTYTVTYNGNSNTDGIVPIDPTQYVEGQTITVLANTGDLVRTGFVFSGWNTQADGLGTTYTETQTFTISTANVILYALWTFPQRAVFYDGNGNTDGIVPIDPTQYAEGQTVTVLANTGNLVKTGHAFLGWNTQADGLGTTYTETQTFTMSAPSVTLYAKWAAVIGYAYVTTSRGIASQYIILTDGSLTPMSPATVSAGANPYSVTADPLGKYVYIVNIFSNNISQYTIGANGGLSPMDPATEVAGTDPYDIAVDPSGKYAYVANDTSNVSQYNMGAISQYTIGADGKLIPMNPAIVDAGMSPRSVIVHPSGKYVYVANFASNSISQYKIGSDGTLAAMNPATVAAGGWPFSITVDPSGKYAYATNVSSNSISQYTISAEGGLTPMTPPTVEAGTQPYFVAVDPSGKYAYVANPSSDNISQYTIGTGGSLIPMTIPTVGAGDGPHSVAVDPSGKYAYVANSVSDNISQYTIGIDGSLIPMTIPAVDAANNPLYITTVAIPQ